LRWQKSKTSRWYSDLYIFVKADLFHEKNIFSMTEYAPKYRYPTTIINNHAKIKLNFRKRLLDGEEGFIFMMNKENRFDLEGKKAIVTGGARGLCFSIVEGLHEAGAEVLIIDLDVEGKIAAEKLSENGKKVHFLHGDLSQLDKIEVLFEKAQSLLDGEIDILVNGVGIQYRCKAEEFPLDKWQKVIDINLNSVFVLSQLVGRSMLDQGHGKIINIASMTSFFGSELVPAYAASKGAIAQLTKALSNEWAHRGVTVNAIAPGYIETTLTADMKAKNPKQYDEITSRIPMHRWGKPDDLKGIAIFLSGDMSSYISGAIIPVDGGYLGK